MVAHQLHAGDGHIYWFEEPGEFRVVNVSPVVILIDSLAAIPQYTCVYYLQKSNYYSHSKHP